MKKIVVQNNSPIFFDNSNMITSSFDKISNSINPCSSQPFVSDKNMLTTLMSNPFKSSGLDVDNIHESFAFNRG